jgi:hypothetical protein
MRENEMLLCGLRARSNTPKTGEERDERLLLYLQVLKREHLRKNVRDERLMSWRYCAANGNAEDGVT